MKLTEIKTAISGLSEQERAELAAWLLRSLDELDEQEAERLWAQEARRRLEEYRAGRAGATKAEDVARRAADLFR
jgi:putative addiction module component (TIGR02574 family)